MFNLKLLPSSIIRLFAILNYLYPIAFRYRDFSKSRYDKQLKLGMDSMERSAISIPAMRKATLRIKLDTYGVIFLFRRRILKTSKSLIAGFSPSPKKTGSGTITKSINL